MTKARFARHSPDPNVAEVAALIGDPGRAAILLALLDGRQLPASELARRAGLSPTAASAHLGKLVAGGLLLVERSGRQRLFRVGGADVGHAIEALAAIAKPPTIVALAQNAIAADMRIARSCYDHLAGRLGVGVTEALVARRAIVPDGSREYRVTRAGARFFAAFGVDVAAAQSSRRHFARQCVDWTERRAHLAGALGAAIRDRLLDAGWIQRTQASRALRITPAGHAALAEHFALEMYPRDAHMLGARG
ncbi:MAG: ArsR/SmtB family transcription factor [Vulcanimicrobiaceae bacterium]